MTHIAANPASSNPSASISAEGPPTPLSPPNPSSPFLLAPPVALTLLLLLLSEQASLNILPMNINKPSPKIAASEIKNIFHQSFHAHWPNRAHELYEGREEEEVEPEEPLLRLLPLIEEEIEPARG